MSSSPGIATFIQARMSSRRFPGKVLAPFRGIPVIDHVIATVRRALPNRELVVATSTERSDDPLANHLAATGIACFRGPLDDVVARFVGCLHAHPCDWIVRICADSPLLPADVVRKVVAGIRDDADLVTTTAPRTFPKGSNVEILRASALERLQREELSADDREHLTRFMHQHRDRYRVVNVESGNHSLAELDLAVDTIADLERLEKSS